MCIGTFGYISGETVSELIFLKYNLDLATQDLFYTSSLWGLQERRWQLWRRWRRWTPAMLAILSSRLCFLREGEDFMLFKRRRRLFCRRGWRSTSIATLDLWMLVFVWTFLYFLTLLSLFHFPETPSPTSPWSLLEPIRGGILPLLSEWTCFLFHLLLYQLHYCESLMNHISLNIDIIKYF